MKTVFVLRFDDLCPTANWPIWDRLEELLDQFGVCPIVSVIPDNRDKGLVVSQPGKNFWDRVRSWQSRKWILGLHGYQHCCFTKKPGLYGRAATSEFAGLPSEVQEIKLQNAVRIFREQRVKPEVWVAPAHSFDVNTIDILWRLGVHVVNDGYALYPYEDERGMVWIPQQLGRFRNLPVGIWTICLHFNRWNGEHLQQFRADLERFRPQIFAVDDVLQVSKGQTWVHAGAARLLDATLRIGRPLREGLKSASRQAWPKTIRRSTER